MPSDYFERFDAGEVLAASRLMSVVERGGDEAEAVLNALFPRVGRAYRIGVTGLTGCGKSTLVNALTQCYRRRDLTVGVVAEDPTSPFSGGAVLGDRVRMLDAGGDEGVFIRSIASRGSEIGFSERATELSDVLDAFGRDVIFLETIGVGQLEHKIRFSAHTTVVVLTPDAGDEIQGLKAGLMEIGDVFVVNKSDRPNASRFADELRSILELRTSGTWLAPVVATVATEDTGTDELIDAVERHRAHLGEEGRMENKRAASLRNRVVAIAEEKLKELVWQNGRIQESLQAACELVVAGERSPYEAAREILKALRAELGSGGAGAAETSSEKDSK